MQSLNIRRPMHLVLMRRVSCSLRSPHTKISLALSQTTRSTLPCFFLCFFQEPESAYKSSYMRLMRPDKSFIPFTFLFSTFSLSFVESSRCYYANPTIHHPSSRPSGRRSRELCFGASEKLCIRATSAAQSYFVEQCIGLFRAEQYSFGLQRDSSVSSTDITN